MIRGQLRSSRVSESVRVELVGVCLIVKKKDRCVFGY